MALTTISRIYYVQLQGILTLDLPEESSMVETSREGSGTYHIISDVGPDHCRGQISRPGKVSLAHNGVIFLNEFRRLRKDIFDLLHRICSFHRLHFGEFPASIENFLARSVEPDRVVPPLHDREAVQRVSLAAAGERK